jgi:hypothetical protein
MGFLAGFILSGVLAFIALGVLDSTLLRGSEGALGAYFLVTLAWIVSAIVFGMVRFGGTLTRKRVHWTAGILAAALLLGLAVTELSARDPDGRDAALLVFLPMLVIVAVYWLALWPWKAPRQI